MENQLRIFWITVCICCPAANSQTITQVDSDFTNQFELLYFNELEPETASSLVKYLESNYLRVMQDLNVSEMPLVTVHIYANYKSLYTAQEDLLGRSYGGSGGFVYWVPDREPEIHAIYDERFEGNRQHTTSLLHEFAHLVSTAVNPSISNNPRWLWETIALYEARQYPNNLAQIDYIAAGDYPSFPDLNRGLNASEIPRPIYHVGYVIGEYIVANWGQEGLISLLNSNGNTTESLGVPESDFERGWQMFLEENYR